MTNEQNLQEPEKKTKSIDKGIQLGKLIGKKLSEGRKFRLRLIPIWLRVILVVLLLFCVSIIGLVIGYSVLGTGEALDVLKWGTWQHIIDIIRGVEE